MAKCILCLGKNTQYIVEEKLDNNVGGIELIQCPFVSNLDKLIKSIGRIDKIIISQSAIDTDLPESIRNINFSVIFILTDKELMQKYDIEFFSDEQISIIDNNINGGKASISFIKELIVANKIEDYLLFKSDTPSYEQEEPIEEEPISIETETPQYEREIEQEEEPKFLIKEKEESVIDFVPEKEPAREISLETEKNIIAPVKKIGETQEETIRNIIKLFKQGCIFTFVGAYKSYSVQNCYRVADLLSRLDLEVVVIDLDTSDYPLSYLTQSLLDKTRYIEDDNLIKAIRKQQFLNNSIMERPGFYVVTGSPAQPKVDFKDPKNIESLSKTIDLEKIKYDVILINLPLEEMNDFSDILIKSSRVIFSIPANNEDYMYFMRYIDMAPDNITDIIFNSCYISINEGKKLLNTNYTDIIALDKFREDFYQIKSFNSFESIKKIGIYIQKNPLEEDSLSKDLTSNKKELMNMILRILEK